MFFISKEQISIAVRSLLSPPCKLYLRLKGSKICNREVGDEKIIVSLTSWTKRIENVRATIDSILNNSVLPDIIVLNLSVEEFPNREDDLPDNLTILQREGFLEINWVEGNNKAFKKFIPTLYRYPYDVIIAIDDDFIYPTDFIETFVNQHRVYPGVPLSGNKETIGLAQAHCGCASLVKKEYFGKTIDTLLDDKVIMYGLDDIFYTICVYLNGLKYQYVGKLFFENMTPNNPVSSLSNNSVYTMAEMKEYLFDKIKRLYHVNIAILDKPVFWL